MAVPRHPQVSTLSLFGYLVTVLSWEFELGFIALQLFSPKKPGFALLALLLAISIGFTVFVVMRGKRDFARLRWTKGRIELSGTQAILVTVFIVLFGGAFGLIAMTIG